MQIGTAILLIAVGAILKYAVDAEAEGFNINTAGVILMIVGVVGLLISLFLYSQRPHRETVVERDRDVYRR